MRLPRSSLDGGRSFRLGLNLQLSAFNQKTFLIDFFARHCSVSSMENTQVSQLAQYIPVLILLVVAIGFAAGVLTLSVLVGYRSKHNRAKDTAYECGKDPIGEGTARFSVKV